MKCMCNYNIFSHFQVMNQSQSQSVASFLTPTNLKIVFDLICEGTSISLPEEQRNLHALFMEHARPFSQSPPATQSLIDMNKGYIAWVLRSIEMSKSTRPTKIQILPDDGLMNASNLTTEFQQNVSKLPPSLESVNCFEPMNNMEDLLVNLKLKRDYDVPINRIQPNQPNQVAKQVSWNMEKEGDGREGEEVKENGDGERENETMMKKIEELTKRIDYLEKAIQHK